MRKDKSIAISYRKQGKSYNTISKRLGIPKSTLSTWLKNLKLPKQVREKLLTSAQRSWAKNIIRYNKKRSQIAIERSLRAQEKAAEDIQTLSARELKLVGTVLYWAEGYKKTRWTLVFCNSDPAIVRVMMRFFREVCKVPEKKFKAQVQIHPNVSEELAKCYWSKISNIPLKQFRKSLTRISKASKKKRPPKTLPYGTFRVIIMDVELVNRIKGWILGLSKEIKRV